MERMMKSFKALFIATVLVIALTTCSNPIDFVAAVTDQVMQAKDMYLKVTEVSPVKFEPAFSPEDPLLIVFDRDVDQASTSAATIVFSPPAEFTSSFDTGTNTLTVNPATLEANTTYSVTLTTGIKGTDASALRDPYVWSFTTTNSPAGTIYVKDISSGSQTYTNSTSVKLDISANGVVTGNLGMRISMTSFTKEDDVVTWQNLVPQIALYDMGGSVLNDGPRTLYYQFRDATDHRTAVKSVTITQDMTAPVITLNNPPTYINSYGWTSDVTVTETGSGIATYAWSKYSGGSSVTLSSDNQLNTTVTGTADGTLRLRLIVTDGAENFGYFYTSTSPYITVDITPPTAPTVTGPGTKTIDTTPDFTWATGGGGNLNFRYKLGSAAWTETASYAASSSISDYGTNTMYVQERDVAGNWSASGYDSTFVYPTWILPVHGATVTGVVTLKWGTTVNSNYRFDVFCRLRGGAWVQIAENTTAISYTYEGKLSGIFEWYYRVYYRGILRDYIPNKTEYFTFRANP